VTKNQTSAAEKAGTLSGKTLLNELLSTDDKVTIDNSPPAEVSTEDLFTVDGKFLPNDLLIVDSGLSTEDLLMVDGELLTDKLLIVGIELLRTC